MNNLDRLRQLVEELPARDKSLKEKALYGDILKEIFLKSPQATAIMGENWQYLLVNELFATLYGCGCPEKMIGKRLNEILSHTQDIPLKEINSLLDEDGIWEGKITLPHQTNGNLLQSKIILKKNIERNILVCTCIQI